MCLALSRQLGVVEIEQDANAVRKGFYVGAGQAVRVMTGAVLPHGADTVVVQECVRVDGNVVCVPPGQTGGQNVRAAGEDLSL